MTLLDTDHLSVLLSEDSHRRERLLANMDSHQNDVIGTTIVTFEEQMRGWLACVAKERQLIRQVSPYAELSVLVEFFVDFMLVKFDHAAAVLADTYSRYRICLSDRKIAAIAVVNQARLITANRRDFEMIPGLQIENWMD